MIPGEAVGIVKRFKCTYVVVRPPLEIKHQVFMCSISGRCIANSCLPEV